MIIVALGMICSSDRVEGDRYPSLLQAMIGHVENDYVTGYSTNSSTLASSVGGIVRSSALAVLRLMISSNAVACRTGRSAGFVPFRIWPARCDRRRRGWRGRRRTRGKPLTRR
jgi:hypothetical protein